MLLIYYASKLFIKKDGNTKKKLILLALKMFLDKIKAHIFLSLERKW